MFLFQRHPQANLPESSFRGDSAPPTSIRLANGSVFHASQNHLSEIHRVGDRVLYYRGWPATDLPERKTIFEKWEEIFGNDKFTLARGSYLLVLIDTAAGKLKVLRDPWGSVPVYYTGNGDIVSDQITSVITLKGVPTFSPAPIAEYLSSSYIAGSRMLYQGIQALTSMQGLLVETQRACSFTNHRYPSTDSKITQDELVTALDAAVGKSVAEVAARLREPAQISVSLSGGTDSSLLVAELLECYGRKAPLLCATVEYADWSRNDTPYFNHVVNAYHLPAHITTIDNQKYADSFVNLTGESRYPYHTFSPSFNALMGEMRATHPARHYLINGTGPDEAVIGFETFPLPKMREFDTTPAKDWVDLLLGRLDCFYTPYWIVKRVLKESFYEDPARERRALAESLLEGCDRFSEFQRRYSKETITDHHIRMLHHIAALHGSEIVFPYLTYELFELSFRAPYY